MSNLTDVIRARRTVNAYHPEIPLGLAEVRAMLETAVYAPNHKLTEPWRFVVLDDAAKIEYAELRRGWAERSGKNPQATYDLFRKVAQFVFVIMREAPDAVTRDEDYAATACVIQNLLLLAQEAGLGSKWSSFPQEDIFRDWLGLAQNECVVGVVHLGIAALVPQSQGRKTLQLQVKQGAAENPV